MINTSVKDWQGKEVAQPESPNARILVWTVTPHPHDSSADYLVERSYHDALNFAKEAIEHLIDITEESELRKSGVQVTIGLEEMTLQDYLEVLEN